MKNLLLAFVISIVCSFQTNAARSLYVDNFVNILGNVTAENQLLSYAEANEIETLLLYDLYNAHALYDLTDPTTNGVLSQFIAKAKNDYGVLKIAATAENGDFFINVIDVYNNSRTSSDEKFDIYNLEFEFWLQSATDPGGYYCDTYLTPNGFPCSNDGAFQFFIGTLQIMDSLATNNSHSISTEAYVGWPTAGQADTIANNLDRLLLHAYVSDPNTSFSYAENRLIDFANGHPELDVSIIFSSEPTFMQTWLTNNSMTAAETIFYNDWQNASSSWNNNIDLVGFTYFTYSFIQNVTAATESIESHVMSVSPNPVDDIITIESDLKIVTVRIFDELGKVVFESSEKTIDLSGISSGVYSVQIDTDQNSNVIKIIKN